MVINFCPECGQKAEESFKFCPACGFKLPKEEVVSDPQTFPESAAPKVTETSLTQSPTTRKTSARKCSYGESAVNVAITPEKLNVMEPAASPLSVHGRKKRTQTTQNQSVRVDSTPEKQEIKELNSSPSSLDGPKRRRLENTPTTRKSARNTSVVESALIVERTPENKEKQHLASSPASLHGSKSKNSPRVRGVKSVKIEPLPENEILTDTQSVKWRLAKFLLAWNTGILYKAYKTPSTAEEQHYIAKLDAKDGRIFTEQNFFQRAAKKTVVDKWKKSHSCSLLGIPDCVGFGVHKSHRFLVFSALGQNLQSIIDEEDGKLPEKAVFHIACRIINALEYIHENEYVHGDITAENIFVNQNETSEVYLAGYYFAFRYCPGGEHVTYREGSRSLHEGTAEFISVDIHKGAAPSRRSDLESLGYCMLKWLCGSLPWSELTNANTIMEQKKRFKTNLAEFLEQSFRQGKVPEGLRRYFEYVMNLDYEEKPDYVVVRKTLSCALTKIGIFPDDPVHI
ncbi:VRK serine/threonine kinase 3 L homeolog isoform X2 [Xenopus laevis]|uniref:VRK serine/threonine kinase 3 L homeolog isoform X2 n=2 Tax=Xenopus laevis TaxID=8355 RepID=A0A1L8GK79_XENLA|nr:VRK serine/threonine kinase 3 L homeolog isoform X2 [Xenopus laevis]OCT84221.1 hypothetical protein XELAEV_18022363mg [Xenopus laevis]